MFRDNYAKDKSAIATQLKEFQPDDSHRRGRRNKQECTDYRCHGYCKQNISKSQIN